jgi:hypothetical protein
MASRFALHAIRAFVALPPARLLVSLALDLLVRLLLHARSLEIPRVASRRAPFAVPTDAEPCHRRRAPRAGGRGPLRRSPHPRAREARRRAVPFR